MNKEAERLAQIRASHRELRDALKVRDQMVLSKESIRRQESKDTSNIILAILASGLSISAAIYSSTSLLLIGGIVAAYVIWRL